MNTKQAHAAEEMICQAFPETPGAIRRQRAPEPWDEPPPVSLPPWVELPFVLGMAVVFVVLWPVCWWVGRGK